MMHESLFLSSIKGLVDLLRKDAKKIRGVGQPMTADLQEMAAGTLEIMVRYVGENHHTHLAEEVLFEIRDAARKYVAAHDDVLYLANIKATLSPTKAGHRLRKLSMLEEKKLKELREILEFRYDPTLNAASDWAEACG